MPLHSFFFPIFVPFHLLAWTYKKLHFHLFKFSHAKNKLASNNLIPKSFPNLGNSKRNSHPCCFLNVKKVDENSLCCFWSKINRTSSFSSRSHFCTKHQVKLTYICPVF